MATPGDTQTQDTRGCLYLENPQKQDHGLPEEGAHGLALPNPSPTPDITAGPHGIYLGSDRVTGVKTLHKHFDLVKNNK